MGILVMVIFLMGVRTFSLVAKALARASHRERRPRIVASPLSSKAPKFGEGGGDVGEPDLQDSYGMRIVTRHSEERLSLGWGDLYRLRQAKHLELEGLTRMRHTARLLHSEPVRFWRSPFSEGIKLELDVER